MNHSFAGINRPKSVTDKSSEADVPKLMLEIKVPSNVEFLVCVR